MIESAPISLIFRRQLDKKTVDRHRPLFRAAGIAALSLLAAACGTTPGARNVPPGASFAANILADDTKLFTFSMRLPKPSEGGRSLRDQDDPQGESRHRARIDYAEGSKKALQVMIEENKYCREGYVLHELYEDRTDYVVRGECRDAATDADKARFSHR